MGARDNPMREQCGGEIEDGSRRRQRDEGTARITAQWPGQQPRSWPG
jgi:hypothetical protein